MNHREEGQGSPAFLRLPAASQWNKGRQCQELRGGNRIWGGWDGKSPGSEPQSLSCKVRLQGPIG